MIRVIFGALVVLFGLQVQVNAQGYKIKVKAVGMADTSCYLAYHYGSNKLLKDTAQFDSKGNCTIEGSKPLPMGIYMIVLPTGQGNRLTEVIIGKEQNFSIEMDTLDPVNSVKTKGTLENDLYYQHLRNEGPIHKNIEALNTRWEEESDPVKKEEIRQQIISEQKKSTDFRDKIIENYPDLVLAKLFKAAKEIEVPEAPVKADGSIDSLFQIFYMRDHYFDNIEFDNDIILRTPIFESKLNFWIEKRNYQIPDSLIKAVDFIVGKAKADSNMYKYTLITLSNYFEKSKRMGTDAILYHIFKKYYVDGDVWWTSAEVDKKIKEYVILHSYNQIGMKAPNLIMRDTAGAFHELYRVDAKLTMVYFWSATCGHCKRATPILQRLHNRYKKEGFEVYSVCIDKELTPYYAYLKKHKHEFINVTDTANTNNFRTWYNVRSTPTTYLLGEDKKIKYKKYDMHSLEKILRQEFKVPEEEEWLTEEGEEDKKH